MLNLATFHAHAGGGAHHCHVGRSQVTQQTCTIMTSQQTTYVVFGISNNCKEETETDFMANGGQSGLSYEVSPQNQRASCKHGNSCFSDLAIHRCPGLLAYTKTLQQLNNLLPRPFRTTAGTRLATETVHVTVHL